LNGQDKLKKTMQTVAIQRETARHESMRRAVLNSSRVFRRRLELFVASVAEWEGDVVQLLMAA
jgi:DNA-binding transcriptional regulator YiaG